MFWLRQRRMDGGAHAQVPRQTPKWIIAPIGSWSGSQTNWQRVADLNYITVMCLTASPFPFKGMFSFQTAQTGEPLFNTLAIWLESQFAEIGKRARRSLTF